MNSFGRVCESISWSDLELLRPMETIIFKDPDSIELIIEFAEENKDHLKATCTKVGLYDYCVYFKEIKGDEKPWHKPAALSPDFLENQLFRMRNSDVVTPDQLRSKIKTCFAASMPEKLSPIYYHMMM